jgi:hypothetical protein
MIIRRISLLLIPITVFLFMIPTVSAIGDFTVDIYEIKREVNFSKNQTSQTFYMDGAVNYTGISATPETISLSSSCDLGESSISPEYVTFHTTGSEVFTVELTIPNNYENGTTTILQVDGSTRQGGVVVGHTDNAQIIIINQSYINDSNQNHNNTEKNQQNGASSEINSILLISIVIIVVTIIGVFLYKKSQYNG